MTLKVLYRIEHKEPNINEEMYKRSVVRGIMYPLQRQAETGFITKERPRRRAQEWTRDLCRSGAGTRGGLLECQELLRAEGLVVNLGGRLNEVLQVSPGVGLSECQISELKGTNLKRKSRRYTNSQCLSSSTLTTPQRFLRPRTGLPSMITLRSEPTTAKGIMLCEDIDQKGVLIRKM